jgi:hypothetical protein
MAPELLNSGRMNDYDDANWDRVSTRNLIGFGAGAALFTLVLFWCEPGFVSLLDHANLLFHEAGHPAIGLLSSRLEVYGGTLGQLTFPVILAVSFWRKRETISFAVSVIWFFENWLNIARYMADARARVLPLVGGGCHDWTEIFIRWRVLRFDTAIAAVVRTVGWLGMGAACVWILWRWWQDRQKPVLDAEASPLDLETELARNGLKNLFK